MADRDYHMGIFVGADELRNASSGAHHTKGLLVDVTYADPQLATHVYNMVAQPSTALQPLLLNRSELWTTRLQDLFVSFDELTFNLEKRLFGVSLTFRLFLGVPSTIS